LNGKLHGKCESWDRSGILNHIKHYKAGVLHGRFKTYRQDGSLWRSSYLYNNNIHGVVKKYYSNGRLQYRHRYYHGKKHGRFTEYNEDGSIFSSSVYAYDVKIG
jgi:antitoxin component YwqK of YwqJK toxin-antitoxin module